MQIAAAVVEVAQAKLAQVKAGAKTGEIQAQQSTIVRLQAELAGEIAVQNAAIATSLVSDYKKHCCWQY